MGHHTYWDVVRERLRSLAKNVLRAFVLVMKPYSYDAMPDGGENVTVPHSVSTTKSLTDLGAKGGGRTLEE